jgi:serine/threonine-protein kinase
MSPLPDTFSSLPTAIQDGPHDTLASGDTHSSDGSLDAPIDPASVSISDLGHETPRYDARKLLGQGGMGEVWLCKDRRVGREIAVKTMRDRNANSPDSRARFLREARVQGQLEHPAVVPVYDIGVDPQGSLFFTMKRVRGHTLDEILGAIRSGDVAAKQKWSRRKLLTAFASVCLSLDYAHARGVVHRDLKPGNIMLGEFGEVHVLDWGLAKVIGVAESDANGDAPEAIDTNGPATSLTRQGSLMGTPGYMAPEQARGRVDLIDGRTDVYALGAILFELLTGEMLHRGETVPALLLSTAEGTDAHASRRRPDAEIAPELDAVCVKATAQDRDARFRSARELSDAIERFLDGDRDVQRRRELAEEHARRAADALARADRNPNESAARSAALREAGRALALDPTHTSAMGIAARLLMEVPAQLPETAEREWAASRETTRRAGAKSAVVRAVTWVAFVPLLLAMGVRDVPSTVAATIGLVATALFALGLSRAPRLTARSSTLLFAFACVALGIASVFAGPFVVMPGLVSTTALLAAFHGEAAERHTVLGFALAAVLVPAFVDSLGLVPAAYSFAHDSIVINARAVHLTPALSWLLLAASSISLVVTPSLLAGRTRDALVAAERRLFANAWQLRQMVPGRE